MPQNTNPSPLQTGNTSNPAAGQHGSRKYYTLGAIFIVSVFLGVLFLVTHPTSRDNVAVPAELSNSTMSGDYAKAVQAYQAVVNNPDKTVEQRALATFNYMGARHRVTLDPKDRLLDVQDIKQVILNTAVSAKTRADSLAWLAGQYESSGYDKEVLAEIFKDAPFNDYYTEGDPGISVRRLFEWSYSLNPNSYAAIGIARWYAVQSTFNTDIDKATRDSYAKLAADYLGLGEKVFESEKQAEPNFVNGLKYVQFITFRAMVIDTLATQKMEPFVSTFRNSTDAYLTEAAASKHVLMPGFVLGARLSYAVALYRNDDAEGAKVQLDKIAEAFASSKSPKVKDVIDSYRNVSKNESAKTLWGVVEEMLPISPNFKAAIEGVTTAN